jgi:hypothetical protein
MRQEPPRLVWPPSPGYFRLRIVRHGWRAPARIVRDGQEWHAVIDGEAYPAAADPRHAPGIDRIWHGGTQIGESEYQYLERLREWAREHQPNHPAANATLPINPNTTPPVRP